MLKLYEELFLLSINDAKGELVGAAASYLNYGLASAILAEGGVATSLLNRKGTTPRSGQVR